LLDSAPTTPCAAAADYAAGTDANGQPVIPADVAAAPVPLPDGIAIPLGNNRGGNPSRGRHQHRPDSQTLGGDSTYVSWMARSWNAFSIRRPVSIRDAEGWGRKANRVKFLRFH
jgi:hypothetical protein